MAFNITFHMTKDSSAKHNLREFESANKGTRTLIPEKYIWIPDELKNEFKNEYQNKDSHEKVEMEFEVFKMQNKKDKEGNIIYQKGNPEKDKCDDKGFLLNGKGKRIPLKEKVLAGSEKRKVTPIEMYEIAAYKKYFGKFIEDKNNDLHGHEDRRTDEFKYWKSNMTKPMELITQVGSSKQGSIDKDLLWECQKELNEWIQKEFGDHVKILESVGHFDETTPHCSTRFTFVSNMNGKDYYDNQRYNRNGALRELGFDIPHPELKEGKKNNLMMSFTQEVRDKWFTILLEHHIDINVIPIRDRPKHLNQKDFEYEQDTKEAGKEILESYISQEKAKADSNIKNYEDRKRKEIDHRITDKDNPQAYINGKKAIADNDVYFYKIDEMKKADKEVKQYKEDELAKAARDLSYEKQEYIDTLKSIHLQNTNNAFQDKAKKFTLVWQEIYKNEDGSISPYENVLANMSNEEAYLRQYGKNLIDSQNDNMQLWYVDLLDNVNGQQIDELYLTAAFQNYIDGIQTDNAVYGEDDIER